MRRRESFLEENGSFYAEFQCVVETVLSQAERSFFSH